MWHRTCVNTAVCVGVGALAVTLAVHPVLRWRRGEEGREGGMKGQKKCGDLLGCLYICQSSKQAFPTQSALSNLPTHHPVYQSTLLPPPTHTPLTYPLEALPIRVLRLAPSVQGPVQDVAAA